MTLVPSTLLLLVACTDYTLNGNKNENGADDTAGNNGNGSNNLENSECPNLTAPSEDCGFSDSCHYEVGGFEPIISWAIPGTSLALPVVADLDGDGIPEVIANIIDSIFPVPGRLQVWHGDGSGMFWEDTSREIAYGGQPAVADVDNDGHPEVFETIQYADNLFGSGEYSVGMWSWDGQFLAESEHFTDGSMDHATGLAIADMNHDGTPEIIAGRAILNPDLTTRAVGRKGRGATMGEIGFVAEGSHPAVADLDLDGQEEIIVGDAIYDVDGNSIGGDPMLSDGSPSVANLDSDPEGEFVVAYGNTYRAQDTDGSLLWGPVEIRTGNILSSPAIGDLDGDGSPEIVVAGGNELHVVHADGTMMWKGRVTDESGATGASIFDFDADGIPEVVYIDEVEMVAYNGTDGVVKFRSTDHGSVTMYDYPVIADVDNDGHANILVANQTNNQGIVVYEDATNSWAPARTVWNQHPYSITNINDDLSVPQNAIPNFTIYNNYHSAQALPAGESLGDDFQVEIVELCEEDCKAGWVRAVVRLRNLSSRDIPAGVWVSVYARTPNGDVLAEAQQTTVVIPAGKTSEGIVFSVPADVAATASGLIARADDDGTGTGAIAECVENDNEFWSEGTFCE